MTVTIFTEESLRYKGNVDNIEGADDLPNESDVT